MNLKINRALLTLAVILTPTISSARIGETKEECKKRYGDDSYQSANDVTVYKINGFRICPEFAPNGKCWKIGYHCDDFKLSNYELFTLLELNTKHKKWKKSSVANLSYLDTENHEFHAEEYKSGYWLKISTAEKMQQIKNDEEAASRKLLEGL